MNEFYTLLWAAMGALIGIIGSTLAVANHFSTRFEALGDRIDKVSADLDKLHSLENERRQTQQVAQAEYRERIEYLINDNRNRADHHRSALEKQLAASKEQVDRQLAALKEENDRTIESFIRELKDFRGYLNKNSDYVVRKSHVDPREN